MTSVFPPQNNVEYNPREQADLTLSSNSQAEALEALSSGTARSILETLDDSPKTTSEIADVVGTSIQNAHYHIQRLEENDLVEPVETWYSVKGKEMTVYALAAEKLVVQFGAAEQSQ